ncbi:MAG: endonuclease III domain-containing protein [Desulfovibrio sp.]|jgi:endonuclease-3 related protein|nr:endonuclease III domain-containing protein [Desulfovibrio sp.]
MPPVSKKAQARHPLLMQMYAAMAGYFGPCGWWPGDSSFEVAVGAVLTQNTAWRNVEKALALLRVKNALRPEALWDMPPELLEEALRPSGFFKLKAQRLRNLLEYMRSFIGWNRSPGDLTLEYMQGETDEKLRRELLQVRGIGQETADAILLYSLNRPSFVVDAYTRRIFSRHGLFSENSSYESIRAFFMDALPLDTELFNEYHALIVRTGNRFCKKSNPLCLQCPLQRF